MADPTGESLKAKERVAADVEEAVLVGEKAWFDQQMA
jgi:hypothetical protein